MLKQVVSVLLLSSLLWGCTGGDDGSGESNGQSSKESQEVANKSDEKQDIDDSPMTIGEIRKEIRKTEKKIQDLGFSYNQDDESIEMVNIESDHDIQNPPAFMDRKTDGKRRRSFTLLPWRYYCSPENNAVMNREQEVINNCYEIVYERYSNFVKQLKRVEFLEKTLLEKYSRELSKQEEVVHLGRLKLTIKIRRRVEAFQRYHSEQTKMKYRTLDEFSDMSFGNISADDILVITDKNKDIYGLHLMAKENDPEISKMAQQKKLFLYSDWVNTENYRGFDSYNQFLKIYVTELFIYVKPVEKSEIPEIRYGQPKTHYFSEFDVRSQGGDNSYWLGDSRWE